MPGLVRIVLAVIGLALAAAAGGCGSDDLKAQAERTLSDLQEEAEEIRREAERLGEEAGRRAEELRDRLREQVQETLARMEQVVPANSLPAPVREPQTSMEAFLVEVLESVDTYWESTLTAADLPQPRVSYAFPAPGERFRTACGATADQASAFYCPADDTIYVGQRMALDVLQATGDFGAAFVIAHEYAHNVQQELGWFTTSQRLDVVKPFELQADCMAGAWANSAYRQGALDPGDIGEAQRTAEAVGDFDITNPQHHGTPAERRSAWQQGFDTGDPASCRRYVPA